MECTIEVRTGRILFLATALSAALVGCGGAGGALPDGLLDATDVPAPDPGGDGPVGDLPGTGLTVAGAVLDQTDQPLAGCSVDASAAGFPVASATTTTGGRFLLTLAVEASPRVLQVRCPGHVPAERTLAGGLAGPQELAPVIMTPVLASGEVGMGGAIVATPDNDLSLEVPPEAFASPVTVSLGRIPMGDPLRDDLRLPAPLPESPGVPVSGLAAVVIDAGGAQPAWPLTARVALGVTLPEGTEVPVGRFDPEAGAWVDAGTGWIEADGRLAFETDHLSIFAASLPAQPDPAVRGPEVSTLDRSMSPFLRGDPRVEPRSGALQVGFDLPPLVRHDGPVGLSFFFDSRTLSDEIEVPVGLPDGRTGETLAVRVTSPLGSARMAATVDASTVQDAVPVVAATLAPAGRPEATGGGGEPMTAEAEASTAKAVDVEVRVSRPAESRLMESASGSFTGPAAGSALVGSDGKPVVAPAPVPRSRTAFTTVARDVRRDSPYGPGWHLQGLTRLVQPWCRPDRILLVGDRDQPARVYGPVEEPFLEDHRAELATAGLSDEETRDTRVARSAGVSYVLFRGRHEVWRRDADAGTLERVAGPGSGAGEQPDWATAEAIAAAPQGGVLVSSARGIHRLAPDGTMTLVVGGGDETNCTGLKEGAAATAAAFCGTAPPSLAQDPTSDRLVFSMPGGDVWESRGGVLHQVRVREGTPHWHYVAFDSKGRLYYVPDMSPCIYRHVDGLEDPLVMPRCRSRNGAIEDGPAVQATVGLPTALAVDGQDRLWFHDQGLGSDGARIRRVTADGEVESVTRPAASKEVQVQGVGGPLQESAVSGVTSLAPGEGSEVLLGGPDVAGFVEGRKPPATVLMTYGAGDGSVLTRQPDGTWVRVLDDGTMETYDARGLLQSRGRDGHPPLVFVYARDWDLPREQETCGEPLAPPRLERITLAGESLFFFEYLGPEGRLSKVTDSTGRTTVWTPGGPGATAFQVSLPGEVTASFRHDEEGRLVERRLEMPQRHEGIWTYEYDGFRLLSVLSPIRGGRLIVAADGQVLVAPAAFNAARIANDVQAREAVGVIPLPGGGEVSVAVTARGLRVDGPGERTTRWDRDPWGRPTRRVAGDGGVLAMTYDAAGRLTELRNEDTGQTWRYRWGRPEDLPGYRPVLDDRLLAREDPLHRTTFFHWDEAGRLSLRVDPDGGTTRWTWETTGAAQGLLRTLTDGAGVQHVVTHDAAGNTTEVFEGRPDGTAGWSWRVTRDAVGRVIRMEDPRTGVSRSDWDERGGLVGQRRLSGDGQEVLESWSFTRAATAAWESVGEPIPASAILRAEDGEGRVWTEDWDEHGRRARSLDVAAGTEEYGHDLAGRLTSIRWDDGSTRVIEWDDAGRPWRQTVGGPAGGGGSTVEYDTLGRVATRVDGAVREVFTWEKGTGIVGLSVSPSGTTGSGVSFTLHRSPVDAVGDEVLDLLGVASLRIRRAFDNTVEEVWAEPLSTPGGYSSLVKVHRDSGRRVVAIDRANGVRTVRAYDDLGRPAWQEEQAPGGTYRVEWRYGQGPRPTGVRLGSVDRDYGWDGAGRLISCGDTGDTATWDRGAARASSPAGAWIRDEGGRLLDSGSATWEHDTRGRVTKRTPRLEGLPVLELRYGPGGLPSEARLDGVLVAQYRYDDLGRRVERITGEGAWYYGYLPDTNRLVRVREPTGRDWMVVDVEGHLGFGAAVAADGAQRFVHFDPFGRVLGWSDESGTFEVAREDCFGSPLTAPAMTGPLPGFHGVLFDGETGLYGVGPRLYDPSIGEFLQPEPMGFAPMAGSYTYAAGDPVLRVDPNGRFLGWAALGVVSVGLAVLYGIGRLAHGQNARQVREANDATLRAADIRPEADRATDIAADKGNRIRNHAVQGGEHAVRSVARAIQTVTNPAQSARDAAEAARDTAEDILDDQRQDPATTPPPAAPEGGTPP